jgi:RNA recognition motif-containing protein
MSKKLFVGNLPFEVNDADLSQVLSVAGKVVEAKIVINKKTGRSKGYGFVEMETEELAKEAVAKFEGATLNERPITVQVASPKMEKEKTEEGEGAATIATDDSQPHGISATATTDPTAGTGDAPVEGSREIGDSTSGSATSSGETPSPA